MNTESDDVIITQADEEPEAPPRVLVVEDEVNLLEGICTILELEKYEVLTAEDGIEALEVLRSQTTPPDLILSDIMMPRMGGLELLQEVRKEHRWLTVPVVFLTARGEKVDVLKAKELGVDDYITKPYDPAELLVAVRSRLERYRDMNKLHGNLLALMKRNILTILNHEFRTPLTFIVAYADMLNQFVAEKLTDEEMKSFLQGVSTGADRLRRLIENFILLVELETNEAKETFNWRRQPIDNVEPLMLLVRDEALSRDGVTGECTLQIAPDIPRFIADQEYIKRALVQLVDNALKFSESKSVVMGADATEGHVRLWVRDEGRGIPVEEQQNILNSFYQIDRPTYEDQGAGSGLAIVKGVIQLHSGQLEIDSQVGVGSTFTMVLPLNPPDHEI